MFWLLAMSYVVTHTLYDRDLAKFITVVSHYYKTKTAQFLANSTPTCIAKSTLTLSTVMTVMPVILLWMIYNKSLFNSRSPKPKTPSQAR